MFACLALGDSLAIGVGHARPDCYVAAITGITSERYVQIFPGMRHVRTAIISLGVNDGEGVATAENLFRLRARVSADIVCWLLTGGNPRARDAVRAVAGRFGNRLIDAAPLAGTDHVHPDRAGYVNGWQPRRAAAAAVRPRPRRIETSCRRPGSYRALPDMKGLERAGHSDGAAVAGVVRP